MTRALMTVLFGLYWLIACSSAYAAGQTPLRYKAVAFDYLVLFNPDSIVPQVERAFPGRGAEFTRAWRSKQFEYAYLRSITHHYADFFDVTADALDYTAAALKLDLAPDARARLLDAYLALKPWPDAVEALQRLKSSGVRLIALTNFSGKMARANADNAGITALFDAVVSTEINKTYKPDPSSYELGVRELRLKPREILFAAFGGWDAYGAKGFGFPTYWVNRFNLPSERLGIAADATSTGLDGLLTYVLGQSGLSAADR